MQSGSDVIAGLLSELGVPSTAMSLLLAHAAAVARDSARIGLVSRGDEHSILPRHTADSLLFALARRPAPGESWVDVGSGAGFPGLVLACCFPETAFTLLEPARLKAGFLDMQIIELGLSNAIVLPKRAESVEERFDVATSRALADPKEAANLMFSLLKPGGEAIVAGTGTLQGAREVLLERPGVDSPGSLFMIGAGNQ